MNLEVRDQALAVIGRREALAAPGVARLHETPWRPGALVRPRTRGVEVDRSSVTGPVVTVRIVADRGRPVLETVRSVQESVRDALLRLTGLAAEVVVVVVDLD